MLPLTAAAVTESIIERAASIFDSEVSFLAKARMKL
jgi:hypothetical protein